MSGPAESEARDDATLGVPTAQPETPNHAADCIVVGGGIAGLVAARELVLAGLSVVVLEASDRAGGKLRAHVVDGLTLDAGAESFATRKGTVADLVERLGLGEDIELPDAAGAWLQASDSDAMPLPKAGLLGIPSVPLAADVIRVIGLRAALRAQLDSLMPGVIGSRETTLGGLVRRRMGARVVERLVAPVTMGVHSRHPDSLAVDAVAPGLRAGLKREASLASTVRALRAAAPAGSAVAGIRGGVSRLVTALVSALERFGIEVKYGAAVVAADASGVTLSDSTRLTARAVVVAAPDRGLTQREGTWPDAEESRIALATLVVRSQELDRAPRGTGVLVAEGCSTITAKALTHSSAKWAWLGEKAGEHRHVLRLSYDARRVEKHDEAAFLDQAISDASTLLGTPLSRGDVLGFARTDWVAGTPDRRAADDGVTRLGETVAGTGLAAVVGHAQREARALAARLAGDAAS
ncbi:MAG: FAD-dependent oxidoreductase [Salinibacterium sp.]|nr:FAD-dependent oxidoreductase [Salinibacterium sp.]MBF0671067.1 FAD-dependent oxidoreductase [Salinibacterium sp.]